MSVVYLVVGTFLLIKAAVHTQGAKPYENCCFLPRGVHKIKCHTDCCMAFLSFNYRKDCRHGQNRPVKERRHVKTRPNGQRYSRGL